MARITILSGSLAGTIVPVGAEAFHIGRQTGSREAFANDLELPDQSISRRHCVIEPADSGIQRRFRIRDLGSANGIKVNDRTTVETELTSGDCIQVGESVLLFDEPDSMFSVPDAGDVMDATATCDETQFQHPAAGPSARSLPESSRYSDDLKALLAISNECNRLHAVHNLQDVFLRTLLGRIPAEFAASIPMHGTGPEEGMSRRCQWAPDSRNLSLGISRTLLRRAHASKAAILFGRKRMAPDVATIESVLASRTESAMVVPAAFADNLRVILYLASSVPDVFDAHHLQLAAAAGNILAAALDRAFAAEALQMENERLLADIRIRHRMLGASPAIGKVLGAIQQVCRTDTTVLICGESGTGKELAAHAIHDNSPRRGRPMVAINCAAFTETLIESELFGHERGAFSGAQGLKRGVFEQAQNGTLFLDEIGELSLIAQAKLLRVLETREVIRIGAEKPVRVDFRLVAATHRSLMERVQAGQFREDLYYRLNVFSFTMPALRERGQDVILLAEHFLDVFRQKTSRHIEGFSPAAREYLIRYPWPGNVRELRNAIERAVIAGLSPHIETEDFPEKIMAARGRGSGSLTYKDALVTARRDIVLEAFRASGGKHAKAAQLLAVHPNNLHRMLKELGIREDAGKNAGSGLKGRPASR